MSRSLRLFVRFMAVLLVMAIAAPFYLTGPGGRPLLTLDRVTTTIVLPSAWAQVFEEPAPAGIAKLRVEGGAVSRWQDEHGIWQFGDAAPEGVDAEATEMRRSITPLGADWNVEATTQHGVGDMPPATPRNPLDGYVQAPELIGKAKQAGGRLHNERLGASAR